MFNVLLSSLTGEGQESVVECSDFSCSAFVPSPAFPIQAPGEEKIAPAGPGSGCACQRGNGRNMILRAIQPFPLDFPS